MAEVAIGLTLGLLPLLIATAEHFDDIARPFRRYRRYHEGIKKFQGSLQTQKTIFRNFCELLLKLSVSDDLASRVLARTTDPSEELALQLSTVLGNSADACLRIVEEVDAILSRIDEENFPELDIEDEEPQPNTHMTRRDIGGAGDSKSKSQSPFRQGQLSRRLHKKDCCNNKLSPSKEKHHDSSPGRVVEACPGELGTTQSMKQKLLRKTVKAKFCFSKSRLDGYLAQLKSLNGDFGTLQAQAQQLLRSQSVVISSTNRTMSRSIRHFRIVQKSSQQLYEVLRKSCTLHVEHTAHFSVDADHTNSGQQSPQQIIFDLALTHRTSQDPKPAVPIWMVIESTWLDNISVASQPSFINREALAAALKRDCKEAPVDQGPKRRKKNVRFEAAVPYPPKPPSKQAPFMPSAIGNAHICKAGNLCTTVRANLRKVSKGKGTQKDPQRVCIGVLDQNDEYQQLVYPSVTKSDSSSPSTLNDILSRGEHNRSVAFSQYERIKLARKLATAILQYHATPWLRTAWRSKDVYFFDSVIDNLPTLAAPHFMTKITTQYQQSSQETTTTVNCQPFAYNQVLFGLGIVLLELGHEATLKKMQRRPVHVGLIDPNHAAASLEFFESQRLGNLVGNRMGSTYGRIVQQCLRCDFGCGADLDDVRLQERVYRDVVCDLESLELKFKALDII